MPRRGLMTDFIVQAQRKKLFFFFFPYWLLYLTDKDRVFFAADLRPNTAEGVESPRKAATLTPELVGGAEREAVRRPDYFK